MSFEWAVIVEALPQLLKGLRLTLLISLFGIAGGLLVGIIVGLMRSYGHATLNAIGFAYVGIIRGTPLIVQVMFIYFALPLAASIRLNPLLAAVIAIIINASAYVAEIVRGAIASVAPGLEEAGLSVGVPWWKVLMFVTGPIAFRRMVPPLGNQFIASLKDTSLFIVIGVGELTRQGQEIIATNFKAVEIWGAVAALYLIVISILTLGLRLIEKRMPII